jgi:hypothetical protein
MMIKPIAPIAIALALVAVPAHAGPTSSAGEFSEQCQDGGLGASGSLRWCVGYARGLADGLDVWRELSPDTALICIDRKVEADTLLEVGLRFVKAHPEYHTAPAPHVLAMAFREAWPCKA